MSQGRQTHRTHIVNRLTCLVRNQADRYSRGRRDFKRGARGLSRVSMDSKDSAAADQTQASAEHGEVAVST